MDIRYIESFLALSEKLNFSKAARKVCISQSAFSRQIASLENEFECSLFVRNKRTVELTEFGKEFYPYARKIISELEEWKSVKMRVRECKNDHLRIGFLCDLPSEIITHIVRDFRLIHESVILGFYDRSLTGIVTGLLENEFDCAFTITNDTEKLDALNSMTLEIFSLCAVLPCSHPLAGKKEISLTEMAQESFLGLENESYTSGGRQMGKLCNDAGFNPRINHRVSLVHSLLSMVEFGMGVALLTDAAKDIAPKNIVFIPLKDKDAFSHLVLIWKHSNANPIVQEFIKCAESLTGTTVQ